MKSRIQSTIMACMALFCTGLTSCTDDALFEASQKHAGKFELTVIQGHPESRLELGQDGLTTEWEPGDKLVLVDKTRKLAPIFLNCTLEEKSPTATFMAESGVPAGDYYVIYNYNENLAYGHKGFQSVDDINSHDDLVLWNELTVVEGVDNASISLNHLYTKIRVELKNAPDLGGADAGNFMIGMYSSKKGFPVYKQFTANGLVDAEYGNNLNSLNSMLTMTYFPSDRKYHHIRFGNYYSTYIWDEATQTSSYDYSEAKGLSALVLPADLSQEEIFFYAILGNTCYEFKKQGVDLKAGTSYKVVLDMAGEDVQVSTLSTIYDNDTWRTVYQLTCALDWRHIAYRNESGSYCEVVQDIDFEGEYFFPISVESLKGGGYTLSNVELDWVNEDNVGLIRHEWEGMDNNGGEPSCTQLINKISSVSELKLENVTFKGNNFVGAFGGWNIAASNCEVIGTSIIEGSGNYVGGIVGINKLYYSDGMNSATKLVDVRMGQSCTVSGKNYVGGIVGRYATDTDYLGNFASSMMLLESCKSEGTVTASEDYVGGIFGKIGGSYYNIYNTSSNIEFSMEDYTFSLVKCVNEGKVTGRHYVGGVGGDFALTANSSGSSLDRVVLSQSCSMGDVTGDTKVGGILGSTLAATNICYSKGAISASTSEVGGIVGSLTMGGYQARIANCYSLATLSGTAVKIGGIVGNAGGGAMGATIVNSYYAADPDVYSYGGIVGNSDGSVNVTNCLTTLNSLGNNLGIHRVRNWVVDDNNDGLPDYGDDTDGDGDSDNDDLYSIWNDNVTDSTPAVTSILDNLAVINGDNAYSTNYWDIDLYPWCCVKFASFSADTNAPIFKEETIN